MRSQILRHSKYLVRRLEYEEIVKTNPIRAVGYLQTRLSEIINHSDPDQLNEFHKLATLLFKCDEETISLNDEAQPSTSQMDVDKTSVETSPNSESKSAEEWSQSTARYHNYTPPPPTICCYGANTLKKDAELFTSKSEEQQFEMKNQRCLLYNKLIELMPEHMVQPKKNLSDFVIL